MGATSIVAEPRNAQKLGKAAQSDPLILAVINSKAAAARPRVTDQVSALAANHRVPIWKIRETVKTFARCGFGDYILGRAGGKTRINWRTTDWADMQATIGRLSDPELDAAMAEEEDAAKETVKDVLLDCEARLERITGTKMHVMLLPQAS